MQIRRILWPTDFSACSGAALSQAVFLARRHGAALDVLHVVVLHDHDPYHPTYHFPDREATFRRLEQIAGEGMKEQLADHDGEALVIREHRRRARAAAPEILRFASARDADLIVLGAHGGRGLRRFVLGSVAEEVVRLAKGPVLTVREQDPPRTPAIRRIVVPCDFSPHAEKALAAGRELAEVHAAEVDLLHVVEAPVYREYYAPLTGPASLDAAAIVARAEAALERFAAEVDGPDVAIRARAIEGIAAASITAYAASSRADLIVTATHGLTGLEHFLLGSVTEKVVRTAGCPVLTLKGPPGPDAYDAMAAGLA